ncbi:MAG: rhodanese-like domain-containing protein [SAR202 cluster bacterium]|nr:rhodanese-like domain-containing protein [SAR202 cluster bacterium]
MSALFLTGCGSSDSTTNQSVGDFAKTISDESVVVLDVRTSGEFAAGHISNSINIDVETGEFANQVANLDKTKTYAIYCQSGRRSAIAASQMAKLGFTSLYNLNGGIGAWAGAGQTVVQD